MSMLLTLAFAYATCRLLPRVVAGIVATFIGTLLTVRSNSARQALLASGPTSTSGATCGRRPNRAQRRALHRSVQASLDATVFTSLLPHVAIRAYKWPTASIMPLVLLVMN
ncbi:hypothetical protein HRV97_17125 [Sphingomonas sp. HHU CXW]|uniref:Uncharacterized protein n=1 Tax=Sphingomonas hominis TaxID=2741495 RepID=A0ABX2JM67_9SPHN|nr:hypothetical protein [Sphingomonas hominis]NTS66859.1 hypothetical protein [Sphingomonas hominis]